MTTLVAVALALVVAACGGDDDTAGGGTAATPTAKTAYPEKPIELIVPFSAGGGTDLFGKLVAAQLKSLVNVQVTSQAMEGQGSARGSRFVADAKPDGYTLLVGTQGAVVEVPLKSDVGYKPEDLEPVAILSSVDTILVVPPKSPFNTLDDLVKFSKANPGKLKFSTSTVGYPLTAILADTLGVQWTEVPFNGSSEAVVAVAGGNVDFSLPSVGSVKSQIASGLVKPLVVTGESKVDGVNAPTLKEAGVNLTLSGWRGIFVPAGTPKEVIAKLESLLEQVSKNPTFIAEMTKLEGQPPVFWNASRSREVTNQVAQLFNKVKDKLPK